MTNPIPARMRMLYLPLLFVAAVAVTPSTAHAAFFNFSCIPDSGGCLSSQNVSGQLSLEVTSASFVPSGGGPAVNGASFLLKNTGSISSVVTGIYFDSRTSAGNTANQLFNFGSSAYTASSGVSFTSLASGGNLPRGNTLSPSFNSDAVANRTSKGGVNNGINNTVGGTESLRISLALLSGQSFNNVLTALGNGNLRLGLHIQSLPNGGSDAYVTSLNPVPEPSAYAAVLAAGLGVLVYFQRRRTTA